EYGGQDGERGRRGAVQTAEKPRAPGGREPRRHGLRGRVQGGCVASQPGPDLRKYAEAVSRGEIQG
uniref:hypothetical protein n=1 Tax=Clavibacter michiganensis TaxID=28447 RepID=UPI00292DFA0F